MSDDQKKQKATKKESVDRNNELDLNDLTIEEPQVEVLSNEDARAIPEVGASILPDFSCTACSSSSM